MSEDPIRRGRNGAAVAKLVLGAILLLLNCCTAFSQTRTGSEETLQRRMNVTACGYGLSGCDESQLTPVEIVHVNATRRRVNVTACGYGFSNCNESQLTGTEAAQVNATRRRMNVTACKYGLSDCNGSRLTPAEAAQVSVTRRRMNALVPQYEPQSQPARSVFVARPSVVPAVSPATQGVAENGSYYGELNKNGVPKTVHVDGYFRSNGTYVRGYYRSAPGTN
jgi:hypothetical protein